MKQKITIVIPTTKPRNSLAHCDIMKKGGVHQKSNKAKRRRDKIFLSSHID